MSPLLTNFVYERAQESTLQEKKQKKYRSIGSHHGIKKKRKKKPAKNWIIDLGSYRSESIISLGRRKICVGGHP